MAAIPDLLPLEQGQTPSPVAPGIVLPDPVAVAEPVIKPSNPDKDYKNGIDARDPIALVEVAKNTWGTPSSTVALKAADLIYKTSKEFDNLINPIEKAGGIATPEGRLAVANTWKTVKDSPQWGDALMLAVMGDKDGARRMITGGQVKKVITYDNQGRPLEEYVNELGEQSKVVELGTGREVSKAEYEARGGGQTEREKTIGFITKKENQAKNIAAYKKNEATTNAWAASAPERLRLERERQDLFGQMKDIPDEIRNKVLEFSTNTYGKSQANSASLDTLKSLTDTKGIKVGEIVGKNLSAALGPGTWKFEGGVKFTNDKGESKSLTDLDQKQVGKNSRTEVDQQHTQTQEDFAKSELYKRLKPEQKLKVDRAIDITYNLEKLNSDLIAEHGGKPSFLVNPSAFTVKDQFARGEIQSIQGEFNAIASDLYRTYRNQMIKNYGPDDSPGPNELEANFVKTPEYIRLQKQYSEKTKDVLKRGPATMPNETKAAETVREENKPMAPPASAPSKGPSGSTPPPTKLPPLRDEDLTPHKTNTPSNR